MSKDQKQACMFCKFWKCESKNAPENLVPSISGACRINPPLVMQAGSQDTDFYAKTSWPMTKGADWCGHFEMPRDDYADIRPWKHISEIGIQIGPEPS